MSSVTRIGLLPDDIAELADRARAEGYRFIERLIDEFHSAQNTSALPGEALFEARSAGALVGVGGINVDPYGASGAAGRIRRLYVFSDRRGLGVGRSLMRAIDLALRMSHNRGHRFCNGQSNEHWLERIS